MNPGSSGDPNAPPAVSNVIPGPLFVTSGGIILGPGALPLAATTGFLYLPSGAGAPSGVPVAYTGTIPAYVDSTNKFLYLYIGGSWLKSTVYA